MGSSHGATCNECGTAVRVNEGPSMRAMPLRCDRCGKEWWWEFGSGGPIGDPDPPAYECGGSFRVDAPARCPACGSVDLGNDPNEPEILYD